MAFLNNADEPTLAVRRPDITRQRQEIEKKIAALVADLPNRFPPEAKPSGDRRSHFAAASIAQWQKREAARTVRWTVLRPATAKANLPHLTILDDNSVFVSGDQSKSDTYDLTFRTDLHGITALRLEVLPDDRLPSGGPGRVYYEGPFGDFFLSEFRVFAGEKKAALAKATHSFASGKATADKAIDGDPQTGWSINGGQGRAHTAVFTLAAPLAEATNLHVQMLFERYHSAGLGRFRISATTDSRAAIARDMPADVEDVLLIPEEKRTAEQKQRLFQQFLLTAPELAKERAKIDRLRKQLPAYPTTLVMSERPPENPRPTFVHNRGEFLQPKDARRAERVVDPAALAEGCAAQSAGPGALAGFAGESVDRPSDNESSVGGVLRTRHRPHLARLRLPGRAAQPSGVARLAGGRAGQAGLVDEKDAQAHRPERDLPAGIAGDAGAAGEGSRQRAAGPRPARAAGGRAGARRGAALQRAALGKDRRAERLSAAAARRDDGRGLRAVAVEGQ